MNEQINQLNQAKSILASVLGVANHSMRQNSNVQEAKGHIHQAIQKLESEQKIQLRRHKKDEPTPHDQWKDVIAGVPSHPVAPHTAQHVTPHTAQAPSMSLDHLNNMIQDEKDKLVELEKKSQNTNDDNNLLTD